MQLASGPGEGEDEGLLAFAQILTRRVSWGWEANTRRKKLPKRPKVGVMVRRPLEAFSAQKRDRQPGTTPDEAGSRPGGQGTAVRAQAAPRPVSACQASDPVSRCSVPPGRAQMIPGKPSLLCCGLSRAFHNQLPVTRELEARGTFASTTNLAEMSPGGLEGRSLRADNLSSRGRGGQWGRENGQAGY